MIIKCDLNLGHHYVICIGNIQIIYYVPVNIVQLIIYVWDLFVIHFGALFVRKKHSGLEWIQTTTNHAVHEFVDDTMDSCDDQYVYL